MIQREHDHNHLEIALEYANTRIKNLETELAKLKHDYEMLDEEHDLLLEEYMNLENEEIH